MKITKSVLKQMIREELDVHNVQEEIAAGLPSADLPDYIRQMENDIEGNTDQILEIFKVMRKYGMIN